MKKQNPPPSSEVFLEARLNAVNNDADSQAVYEAVYSDVGLSQPESYYLWILSLLDIKNGERLLDVSCGRSELLMFARQHGVQGHGIDLSENALIFGRNQHHNQRLATANSQQLPYADASFNVLCNLGSLEHYTDMPLAVREMARVLHPQGRALILVPNSFSLSLNIWMAWRNGRTYVDPYQPIQRYAARYEWQDLLEANGLQVMRTVKYEHPPFPLTASDRKRALTRPKEMIRLLATPLIPLNLAFCFVFICQK